MDRPFTNLTASGDLSSGRSVSGDRAPAVDPRDSSSADGGPADRLGVVRVDPDPARHFARLAARVRFQVGDDFAATGSARRAVEPFADERPA
jgi:hypothetical protein